MREQPRRLDAHRHVGQLELDRLQLRDGLVEGLPLLRVAECALERRLRDAEGLRGDADAAASKGLHGEFETKAILSDAVGLGHLDVLEGALDVDARDGYGWTALHYAAFNGHTACLKALLAAGASVHSRCNYGCTPLHFASQDGEAASVRALIAAGSDVHRADRDGWTPFTAAVLNGHLRVLKILLRAGADVHTGGVTRRNKHKNNNNTSAWAVVDEIRAAGGWQNYVTLRRAALVRAISDAVRGKFPDVINLEIATYVEPPGGYD